MEKMNREINQLKYHESEVRIQNNVMKSITAKKSKRFVFKNKLSMSLVTSLTIIIVMLSIVLLSGGNTNTQVSALSDFQNKKLAEISYMSGSLIAASTSGITVATSNPLTQLSNPIRLDNALETEFESNLPTINLYFDMLRVFIEDDLFSNQIILSESDDMLYDNLITFTSNGYTYNFYISVDEDYNITGKLLFDNREFSVSGDIRETSTSTEFTLEANSINSNDYVIIDYETESEDEIESEYHITSFINNITISRIINIEHEGDESKVEIHENGNEFQLEKEFENGMIEYELQYHINGVEGSAVIYEQVDEFGVVSYIYQLTEGEYEKELESNRPDYDHD